MYTKPLIINSNGHIYIFPENTDLEFQQLIEIESKSRQFTTSVKYTIEVHEFIFDQYSIWSLLIMGDELFNDFMKLLSDNSVTALPKKLLDTINQEKSNFKQVLLKEDLENIVITILQGDLQSLINKYLKDILLYNKETDHYYYKKDNSRKVTDTLLKNNVSVLFDSYIDNITNYPINFKCNFELRYYQKEAFNMIIHNKNRNGMIFMPPSSGKTFLELKLIEYFKIPTLFLCDNYEEYIYDLFLSYTDISENEISKYKKDSVIKPITICSYQNLKNSKSDALKKVKWGIIFYNDAQRSLAETYSKSLFFKSKYKFASAATLYRSDGKGNYLFRIIGPKLYNIQWNDLCLNNYVKNIQYNIIKMNIRKINEVCDKIIRMYPNKRILICSYYIDIGNSISKSLNIKFLNGSRCNSDTMKKIQEKSVVNEFINGKLNLLCISEIIQRIQINDIDVFISISHNGMSQREETYRIGKAVCTNKHIKNQPVVNYYSLVNSKEVKSFEKRLNSSRNFIKNINYIYDNDFIEGDY